MAPRLTPSERSLQNTVNGLSTHIRGKTNTGPAREAFNKRFELEVDPDRVLDVRERRRRAELARRRYFAQLALRSAKARRKAS